MPTRLKQLKDKEKRTTTPSDLLADLHVYILPKTKWIPFRRLARNHVIEETVSAGFVRVSPTSTLFELRSILSHQLDLDFPQHYAFIRSVGRNFTQVKKHQEAILKVKHFLPPQAVEPEIHVLEVSADLVKKSGSVPNLLLSETDFSDQGTNSVLTGRLSQIDLNGSSRNQSRMFIPQNQLGYGGHSVHEDRLRSYSNGREPTIDGIPYQEIRNERAAVRTDGTTDEEDYQGNQLQNNKANGVDRSHSKSGQRSSSKRKKAVLGARLNRGTQSSTEGDGDKVNRRRSEGVRPHSYNDAAFGDIRRASSLNVLANRSASQESLAEEADKMGQGYTERSRQLIRGRPNQGRSISVGAIEGGRSYQSNINNTTSNSDDGGKSGQQSSQKTRSRSTGDYAPHKWKLEREARMLEKEIKIRTRLMEEELEAMREAQKAEEARRFEEELKKEEEIYNQRKDKAEPQSRTEILNLEGENPVVVVEEKSSRSKRTDLQYPPEGLQENQIVGRLIGDHNEGFEITYELEFSDEDDDDEEDYAYDEDESGARKRNLGRKKNDATARRGRDRHKKTINREGGLNNKKLGKTINKNKTNENKIVNENKNKKIYSRDNKKETESHRNILKAEKENQESNKNKKMESENNKKLHKNQIRKGAWAENENGSTPNLRAAALQSEKEPDTKKDETNQLEPNDNKEEGPKKIKSSYHNKKRILNTALQKEKNVPRENIEDVRKERQIFEDNRTNLFNHARAVHEKILVLKEKKRQRWWDEYNLARRKGARLEERQANLRQELEALYRRVLGALLRRQPLVTGLKDEPSRKASYKISVIRLRHEIADLLRRVEAIDIKLQAELRLRQQAEREVKQLRSEVGRKKANVALSQSRAPLLRNIAFIPDDILIRL